MDQIFISLRTAKHSTDLLLFDLKKNAFFYMFYHSIFYFGIES